MIAVSCLLESLIQKFQHQTLKRTYVDLQQITEFVNVFTDVLSYIGDGSLYSVGCGKNRQDRASQPGRRPIRIEF